MPPLAAAVVGRVGGGTGHTRTSPSSAGTPPDGVLTSRGTLPREPGSTEAGWRPGRSSATGLIAMSRSAADGRVATPNRYRPSRLPLAALIPHASPSAPTVSITHLDNQPFPLAPPPSPTALSHRSSLPDDPSISNRKSLNTIATAGCLPLEPVLAGAEPGGSLWHGCG